MTTDILSISYTLDDALAIISLHHEPVNSMNTAFWKTLLRTLSELEANPKVHGIIFTSTLKRNVFTAGDDLAELYAPLTSLAQYINFWVISNTFLARLYTSPLLTMAAVKGACPAGGCCLAMCCDFRIVTQDVSMGLNEVAIGLSVPGNWIKVMISIIGQGKTDKLTQCARLVGAEEASKIGLVDTVVSNASALEPTALKLARDIFKSPDSGRIRIKALLRGELGRSWGDRSGLEREAHQSWGFLTKEETVKALEAAMLKLSKPRGKSKI